ncbi:MAG: flagellar biosynthetic protein FliO [Cellvibrio sp.]
MLVAILFSTSSAYAETSSATTDVSSAQAAQQDKAVSSVASSLQSSAAETVTPFYQKTDAQQNAAKAPPKVGSGGHLVNVALGLIAIIALIYALSQFVKRFGGGAFSGNSQLKILSSMPLGTRERIVLIDAGGQQLLLGITPTNINTLHVFAEPIVIDNKPEAQSDFSRKLMTILQQKQSGPSSNDKNGSASQG